jgi:hypothetical protein
MQLRRVGDGKRVLTEISIAPMKGARRQKSGLVEYQPVAPYIPTSMKMAFHPGGNSLCFAIQLAHLMGADPIHLVGFTLQSGSRYFFGSMNPIVKHGRPRMTLYQEERPLAWCAYYEKLFPERCLLDPSFDGPIYKIFKQATFMRSKPAPDSQLPTPQDTNQVREVKMPENKDFKSIDSVTMPTMGEDCDKMQKPAQLGGGL